MSKTVKTGWDDFLVEHGPAAFREIAPIDLKHPAFKKQRSWWPRWKGRRSGCKSNPAETNEAIVEPSVRSDRYRSTSQGMVWQKFTQGGSTPVLLTNFAARIVTEIIEDDGVEPRRVFEIEAVQMSRTIRFTVSASDFNALNWVLLNLGAAAIIFPGTLRREHVRTAIQSVSKPARRHSYTHTGWRDCDGGMYYLTASGGIGRSGLVREIDVTLPGVLDGYRLPDPPAKGELAERVRLEIELLDLAPNTIMFPLLAAVFRAVLGGADFSMYLTGRTGTFKTEIAALVQQHFGSQMNARNLPGSWTSTGNALEGLAFAAKDAILVVDDFVPTGNLHAVNDQHRTADRVLRGQGNGAGRIRMRSDGTLRPPQPPRGLILSTGEDVPRGHSLRSRAMILEIGPNDVDTIRLTKAQGLAGEGIYSSVLAGYLRWLAPRARDAINPDRRALGPLLERVAKSAVHRRTPDIVAQLALGLRYFFDFANEIGALSDSGAGDLWDRAWEALLQTSNKQAAHQGANEPAQRFIDLLKAAISSGRAHLAARNGDAPKDGGSWGWREVSVAPVHESRLQPCGERIGWVEDDDIFLSPDVSFAVVQKLAGEHGEPITISEQTLRRRLNEKNLLKLIDKTRETLTVRRTIERRTMDVLVMDSKVLGYGVGES